LLHQDNLEIVPTSTVIAERAARLRATYKLRAPDAIQVATALQMGAGFFLTNDRQLQVITELEVLVLSALGDDG
jgi:predicted nucleic acid-binding protein